MRAILFTIVLLIFLHEFLPYLNDSRAAANRNEVEAFAARTQEMTPQDVVRHLQHSSRPTMLVVYASWCHYCKRMMPNLHALWEQGKIPGDQMLLVSIDEQPYALAEYLLTSRFNNMVSVPVVVKQESKTAFADALDPLGSGFNGGIPYIGFFAKGGRLIDEIRGVPDPGELEDMLADLR